MSCPSCFLLYECSADQYARAHLRTVGQTDSPLLCQTWNSSLPLPYQDDTWRLWDLCPDWLPRHCPDSSVQSGYHSFVQCRI